MPLGTNTMDPMLGLEFRFEIMIDDISFGQWASCKGLKVTFTPKKVTELGLNTHSTYLPGTVDYTNITLTRAVNKLDSAKLISWLSRSASTYSPSTGMIRLKNAHDEEVASWTLRNVYPISWAGPVMNTLQPKVATETLVVAHEGFLDV